MKKVLLLMAALALLALALAACEGTGLVKDSVVLAEQIRTLDKRRLRERIGALRPEVMARVGEAVKVSLGIKL